MKSNPKFLALPALFLLLAACAQAAVPGVSPSDTAQSPQDSPLPAAETQTPAYPGPDEPVAMPAEDSPQRTTGYAPQLGDELLDRGGVFVEESGILTMESYPPQFVLHLTGNLPTPCYELRAVVSEPGKDSRIDVELYALTDPAAMCAQVLVPFEANIPLGSYTDGRYPVTINGEQQVGVIEP